jgi:hypothetical protein
MQAIATIGFDVAKSAFQGTESYGKVTVRRRFKRPVHDRD